MRDVDTLYYNNMKRCMKMKKKIMIVDDNHDIITMVKKGLEHLSQDYEVIPLDSGKKCLDFLNTHELPDLIILDIMMPEMDGWETVNKIKERPAWGHIPVVFLTAKTDEQTKKQSKFVSADFIEKPIKIPDLKDRIELVMNMTFNLDSEPYS